MTHSGPDVGAQIRARRQQQGLTLDALAQSSGVSSAMLSEVERSVKNPTVKLAWQIARALGCSLTELLDEPGAPTRLVKAEQRRSLVDAEGGVQRHGVTTTLARGGLEVVTYVLGPRATTGEMPANRAGVLEHLTVVRGRLRLTLGDEEIALGAGDHITYAPQFAVEYRNAGRGELEFVLLSDGGAAGREH
ncbi:MAG: helix-turn-helix domain-containing protein [Acidobacteria bacterium]|nr:helix-turn-helix domain-containing protein [Acidobacteriota bacterium]